MKLLITICARGGSKGIPGKNVKPLNGKPLLHYTLEQALVFAKKHQATIQVSTDDENIINSAESLGYKTDYRRPAALATDEVGKIAVIRAAWTYAEKLHQCQYDYVFDLDVTAPLRTQEDLEKAFSLIQENQQALNIFSVNPAARNPYFNMVEERLDGFVKLVKGDNIILSRQKAPKVYDMNASFYIFTRDYMEADFPSSITDRSLVYEMPHVCFDIDHPFDFTMMELLLKHEALDFNI
jgi:CMP-N-acetylneuraminic acid synthetase